MFVVNKNNNKMINAGKHLSGTFDENEERSYEVYWENINVEASVTIKEGPMEACGWGTDGGIDHYEPAWIEREVEIVMVWDSEGDEIEDYDYDEILDLLRSI